MKRQRSGGAPGLGPQRSGGARGLEPQRRGWGTWLAGLAVAVVACSAPDKGAIERQPATTRARLAPFQTLVSPVFEKHCGSLDCHGGIGRNLRIYSANGLRLPNDAGLHTGSGDTSDEERLANYQSILGLEPERTEEVLAGADPYELLVLKKPLAIESHKGGQPIRRGDDSETCIVSWLRASDETPIDLNACTRAAIFPKE